MERSIWKDQELNRLESWVELQNIPKNTKDYIESLIVRASKYCGTIDSVVMNTPIDSHTNEEIQCFGKFSKDDVYCKECEVAVECYDKTENRL